jgi:dTMP kinase
MAIFNGLHKETPARRRAESEEPETCRLFPESGIAHRGQPDHSCYSGGVALRSRRILNRWQEPLVAKRRSHTAGTFITLEGTEGSGKSTQATRLAQALRAEGHAVLLTREPGGTPVAEQLRAVLLKTNVESLAAETEAFVILAARRQHVDQVIAPALQEGAFVICDRFVDSTLAYQGYARGLDLKILRTMNTWATGGLTPDLTLLFDLPVATGLRRRQLDAAGQNRLDRETKRFHENVRSGFLQLARKEPRRIKQLNAARSPDRIAEEVRTLVFDWIESRQPRSGRRK